MSWGLHLTVGIIAFAWGLQQLIQQAALRKERRKQVPCSASQDAPAHLCTLSPAAVKLLLEVQPFPHRTIEVVADTDLLEGGQQQSAGSSRPPTMQVRVAESEVELLWQDGGLWPQRRLPSPSTLLVFAAREHETARRAACTAAAAGYHRCACLATAELSPSDWSRAEALQFLSRHALAVILGYGPAWVAVPCILLDVRRHDERTLYGCLPGSVHIPVELLPAALEMSPEAFLAQHKFAKPCPSDNLILYSRGAGLRASWAAQVCMDAGLERVYVYRQGTAGWRFDSNVKVYKDYSLEDGVGPPEPEVAALDCVDEAAGLEELIQLGLVEEQQRDEGG